MSISRGFLGLCLLLVVDMVVAASLGQIIVTDRILPVTMQPMMARTQFSGDVQEIWATGFLQDAEPGTRIATRWLRRSGEQVETVAELEIQGEGTRFVAMRIRPVPGDRLPAGEYQVQFYVDGQSAGFSNFSIAPSSGPAPVQAPGDRSGVCGPAQFGKLGAEQALQAAREDADLRAADPRIHEDPAGRFRALIPGSWHQIRDTNPDTVLFLRQNPQGDPIAEIVIRIYDIEPGSTAGYRQVVETMTNNLLEEGRAIGVRVIDQGVESFEQAPWAESYLQMTYQVSDGRQVLQFYDILAVGRYAFVITFAVESEAADRLEDLLIMPFYTFWSDEYCRVIQEAAGNDVSGTRQAVSGSGLIRQAVLAGGVTADRRAVGASDVFDSRTEAIYCVFAVRRDARGKTLQLRLVPDARPDTVIREDSSHIPVDIPEDRLRNFYEFRHPHGPWPAGTYRLQMFIDGTLERELPFRIESTTAE